MIQKSVTIPFLYSLNKSVKKLQCDRPNGKVTERKISTVFEVSSASQSNVEHKYSTRNMCVCIIGTIGSELQNYLQNTEVSQADLEYQGIEGVTYKQIFFKPFDYDPHKKIQFRVQHNTHTYSYPKTRIL